MEENAESNLIINERFLEKKTQRKENEFNYDLNRIQKYETLSKEIDSKIIEKQKICVKLIRELGEETIFSKLV